MIPPGEGISEMRDADGKRLRQPHRRLAKRINKVIGTRMMAE